MSDSRVFFPFCPSRFEMLMAEFLFRVDPARTACVENGDEDEYEFLADAIADHLVENDGVLTEADWVALTEDVFGIIEFPFTEKNIAKFHAFFPEAIVHANGVQI